MDIAEEGDDDEANTNAASFSEEILKHYENFSSSNQLNYNNIYTNAIEYKLTPNLLSTLSISNVSKCTLWLQKESQQDRIEYAGIFIYINV